MSSPVPVCMFLSVVAAALDRSNNKLNVSCDSVASLNVKSFTKETTFTSLLMPVLSRVAEMLILPSTFNERCLKIKKNK